MKKTIEIDIPEGMDVKYNYKSHKIEFIPKESEWKNIKAFSDVLKYNNLSQWDWEQHQGFFPEMTKYLLITKTFIEASNDTLTLTEGKPFWPYCYITYNKPESSDYNIINCRVRGKEAFLVCGRADDGRYAGLGCSVSYYPVSSSGTNVGFRAYSNYDVAKHVSYYFSKELIDAIIGWRTNEIEWLK